MREERVLITGAGSGLGRAMAVHLTKAGVPVVGLGRRSEALAETCGLCEGFTGIPCDVADPGAVEAAVAKAGPISILINNAAVYPRVDLLEESTESLQQTLAINTGGTIAATKAVLPSMVAQGRGQILFVSSFADVAPLPASAGYSVSKGAQRIFARAVHADLGDRFPRIQTITWMPGALKTSMGLPDGIPPDVAGEWGAALALWREPGLGGTTFEQNRELPPPLGLKSRIKNKILFQKPKVRIVPSISGALATRLEGE